jgi:hypothetical protein
MSNQEDAGGKNKAKDKEVKVLAQPAKASAKAAKSSAQPVKFPSQLVKVFTQTEQAPPSQGWVGKSKDCEYPLLRVL